MNWAQGNFDNVHQRKFCLIVLEFPRGKGAQVPGRRITGGVGSAEKSQEYCKYFLKTQHICF